jgi:hypothetical protein
MFQRSQVRARERQADDVRVGTAAERGFCSVCGTQICFTAECISGLIDITIGGLDRPEMVAPTLHYWDPSRWLGFLCRRPAMFPRSRRRVRSKQDSSARLS